MQSQKRIRDNGRAFPSLVMLCLIFVVAETVARADETLRVGLAESDITPPDGFPMAGYYHERLATGSLDPLKAKAVVFRQGKQSAALVVCDLGAIAVDLARQVRRRASELTGIPADNIVVAATHSHTAPDYFKDLYLYLEGRRLSLERGQYVEQLIDRIVQSLVSADQSVQTSVLAAGTAMQRTPVAFNRRFVMRDGSARTWMRLSHPDVVRAAGPDDPQLNLVHIQSVDGTTRGVLSNFALHLDTVGGLNWSGDYPYFIEQSLRDHAGHDVVSLFATGCCGDINHVDPTREERNKTDFIGNSLGSTLVSQLEQLQPLAETRLTVESTVVELPLQSVTQEQVAKAVDLLSAVQRNEKVDFYDQVTAYKQILLDQLRHDSPQVNPEEFISWGLSHHWAGVGETLPVDVHAICLGEDVAIVCLPGEVFVELGLAIKQASPFPTTLLVELANCAETIYIPTRAAYAQGSYEVTNSALKPGAGEMLVEAALRLLRKAAETEARAATP